MMAREWNAVGGKWSGGGKPRSVMATGRPGGGKSEWCSLGARKGGRILKLKGEGSGGRAQEEQSREQWHVRWVEEWKNNSCEVERGSGTVRGTSLSGKVKRDSRGNLWMVEKWKRNGRENIAK